MNKLFIILSFCILFYPLYRIEAYEYSTCLTENHNFDSSSFTGLTDFSLNQNGNGNIDCITRLSLNEVILTLSSDRTIIHVNNYNEISWVLCSWDGGVGCVAGDNSVYGSMDSSIPDGDYYYKTSDLINYDFSKSINIYKVDGLYYYSVNDIPVDSPSGTPTGNIEFGLGIIIVFMSLAFVGFIWNSMTKKKPWK
ncbi:MAG: hypothetical protein RL662_1863 [Bacteroidota bacterium]|jgi:hypothetical protein